MFYLYGYKDQQLDLDLIPNKLTYCGSEITENSRAYQDIVSWLKSNKNGWITSSKKYNSNLAYPADNYDVNILPNAVVVSHKTDNELTQHVKIIEHQLSTQCEFNI